MAVELDGRSPLLVHELGPRYNLSLRIRCSTIAKKAISGAAAPNDPWQAAQEEALGQSEVPGSEKIMGGPVQLTSLIMNQF